MSLKQNVIALRPFFGWVTNTKKESPPLNAESGHHLARFQHAVVLNGRLSPIATNVTLSQSKCGVGEVGRGPGGTLKIVMLNRGSLRFYRRSLTWLAEKPLRVE